MTPLDGLPILTAAAMRAAEGAAVAQGIAVETLMARAGAGVAEWAARLGSGARTLVLCGPGNNGGDGYVAARLLAEAGIDVAVAASAPPAGDLAKAMAARWTGPVAPLAAAGPAPVVVDALFGTGLSRPLAEADAAALARLVAAARLSLAVDLPSGLASDDGVALGAVPRFDVTLALGALKPAHLLQPGAAVCGAIRLVAIGVAAASATHVLARPDLPPPGADAHKFSRGMVAVVAGAMPGATILAGEAALRAGAGYVALFGGKTLPATQAIVRRRLAPDSLTDPRIGCVLVGPGLGRDDGARARLDQALASGRPLVVDGDALHLLGGHRFGGPAILTPHAGEFAALFGAGAGSKLDRTRAAASRSNAVVVFKGADTVIAAPDGRVAVAPPASGWLSTAGTGDVLAGAIAAMLAGGRDPFAAAQAGVWLHAEAARRLGAAFVADDLARALSDVRAA